MQGLIDIFLYAIQKLEQQEIPYMVVGSIASMVYGEPRMTHDMDLVIDLLPADAEKIENIFPLKEFYCPPLEVIKSETIHRGQFNLIHHESGLKIDLVLRKKTEHSIEEFKRRRKVTFWKDAEVFLASPEDVIIKKLDFFRQGGSEKHLKDIRGILAETSVDKKYLEFWLAKLGLQREWDQL
ncbi:MAG: hypothetical protein AB7H97_15220 [Pseudobdellovibrionaceae bacterium]